MSNFKPQTESRQHLAFIYGSSLICNYLFEPFFVARSYVISVERVRLACSYVMNYFRLHCITFDDIGIISVYICMISVCIC